MRNDISSCELSRKEGDDIRDKLLLNRYLTSMMIAFAIVEVKPDSVH